MERNEVVARIREIGIMPSVRVSDPEHALFAAETMNKAGISIAEITLTTHGAIDVIAQLASNDPNLVVGAGTVLDVETAQRCVDAGARFLSSPGLIPKVVDFAV